MTSNVDKSSSPFRIALYYMDTFGITVFLNVSGLLGVYDHIRSHESTAVMKMNVICYIFYCKAEWQVGEQIGSKAVFLNNVSFYSCRNRGEMSFQRLSEKLWKIVDLQFPLQSHADNTEGVSRKLIGLKIFHNYTF